MNAHRFWLVVPAAGIGQRMQSAVPKQYLTLADRFLLDVTLSRLLAACAWEGCVVPLHPEDRWWRHSESAADGRIETCAGGAERVDSVIAALRHLEGRAGDQDWVLVHDVARPCVHRSDLHRLRNELAPDSVGGLLAAPVSDTVKQVAPGSDRVSGTADRRQLWRAFTPQMFRYGDLLPALETGAREHAGAITDEASAMELAGWRPRVVAGRTDNIKITVPEDLALAEFILARQDAG
ncbi:2-C-methyl-D-erythritol 4-phosphate cytidylyltransferase [Marinobacter zhanjiangensis]|uniref:2-C-methyl-D-erythritol 4-phosphate cytidylyltransferase n=1 Tax=Marinobacter zhanjiangensis TaxID=578215 RepID=A0ABQ3ASV6_9GAMM|nr:2-C-methyl-D-erythritol 4-phosphate cytidylyltransferase [Marinobacter zhanjiangensis]GGY64943.1 2-C-methyl-D-erythritol 4-phosphate cytidylyltransferase [Marinobacter zhanjiangensis]